MRFLIGLLVLAIFAFASIPTFLPPLYREAMVAGGTTLAGLAAAVGIVLAWYASSREHKTAVQLHTDAATREQKREEQNKIALATALFSEIHHLASRCVLDGITWSAHIDSSRQRLRHDALKFRPFTPAVYRAMADRLMELPPDVAHLVVRFYNSLEAADRQIRDLKENPESLQPRSGGSVYAPPDATSASENLKVTARFHQLLKPALSAMTALRPLVQDSNELERILRAGDSQYLADKNVLSALDVSEPQLLYDALEKRIEWFQNHPKLRPFFY
jgi:hypothetical protein